MEAKRGECEIETPETETINGVHGKYREVDEAQIDEREEGKKGRDIYIYIRIYLYTRRENERAAGLLKQEERKRVDRRGGERRVTVGENRAATSQRARGVGVLHNTIVNS